MRMHTRTQALGAIALSTLAAQAGPGLFGVDSLGDNLVRINTQTGAVSVVGSLGYDASNIELAWSDGVLYAVNSVAGQGADLMRIDPVTGAASNITAINIATDTQSGVATTVEGFTADPISGQLYASVRDNNNLPAWQANAIGMLNTSGVITDWIDYGPTTDRADFDALEMIQSGEFIAADGRPPFAIGLRRVTLAPSNEMLASYAIGDPIAAVNDFAWTGDVLWGVDSRANQLVQIDPMFLTIGGSQPYASGYEINAIAPIPAPATGALALGLAGFASRRRR